MKIPEFGLLMKTYEQKEMFRHMKEVFNSNEVNTFKIWNKKTKKKRIDKNSRLYLYYKSYSKDEKKEITWEEISD